MERLDVWEEIDNRKNELFEFVRSHLPYTEDELKQKPIVQFMDIVERAKKRVEAEEKAAKKRVKGQK